MSIEHDFRSEIAKLPTVPASDLTAILARVFMRGLYLAADNPPNISSEYLLEYFRGLLDIGLEAIEVTRYGMTETSWDCEFEPDEVTVSFTRPSIAMFVSFQEHGAEFELTTFAKGTETTAGIIASTFELPASSLNVVERGDLREDIEACLRNERPLDLFFAPLWRQPIPHIQSDIEKLCKFLEASSEDWSFWIEWLSGILSGAPLDWELQLQVAQIGEAAWKSGPDAVAAEIERIKAEMLSKKLPMAETIELNPETGKFRALPLEIAKPSLLAATLTRVEDTLDDVLANPSNGLHDRSREVRDLRRAMIKHGNDPQQIEMAFTSAYKSMVRQILNDDLPPSEENLALQEALEEGARGIRATHPDVAENRKIWSEQAIRELPEKAVQQLHEALPKMVAISDPEMAEDWQHDIPQLISDAMLPLPTGAPALPGADETTRIFSRAAKISLLLKTTEIIHKIDGSAGYKAATIVATVATLVTLGLSLL